MCFHYREPFQRPLAWALCSMAIRREYFRDIFCKMMAQGLHHNLGLTYWSLLCHYGTEERRGEGNRGEEGVWTFFGLVWIWFCFRSCDFVTNRGNSIDFVTSKCVYRPLKVAGTCELCEIFLVIQVMVILSAQKQLALKTFRLSSRRI